MLVRLSDGVMAAAQRSSTSSLQQTCVYQTFSSENFLFCVLSLFINCLYVKKGVVRGISYLKKGNEEMAIWDLMMARTG